MSESSPPIKYDVATLVSYDFFGYNPSLALAGTALALYLLAAVAVFFQNRLAKNPNAKYMVLITTTALIEAGGYAALVWLINNSGKGNIYGGYVVFQVLVILSPNLIQAADYVSVSKIIEYSNMSEAKRFLRPIYVSIGFIVADVIALLVQAVGITIWASSKGSGEPNQSLISLGSWITVGGLVMQLIAFLLFAFLAAWVHRHPKNQLRGQFKHSRLFLGLYISMVLVTIRNIFRFVEFTQGALLSWPAPDDVFVISENEALFYCLDTLPILLCFVTFLALNPANLLPKERVEKITDGARGADIGSSGESSQSTDEKFKGSQTADIV